jgi:hypothetical protein
MLFQGQGFAGQSISFGTPAVLFPGFNCGVSGAPAPIMLEAAVGTRQLSMRYLDCGCNPGIPAQFSERQLWVAPMLTTA